MRNVAVTLTNPANLRLCLSVAVAVRSIGHENAARDRAEALANEDAAHGKHGPWIARSSAFTN